MCLDKAGAIFSELGLLRVSALTSNHVGFMQAHAGFMQAHVGFMQASHMSSVLVIPWIL